MLAWEWATHPRVCEGHPVAMAIQRMQGALWGGGACGLHYSVARSCICMYNIYICHQVQLKVSI